MDFLRTQVLETLEEDDDLHKMAGGLFDMVESVANDVNNSNIVEVVADELKRVRDGANEVINKIEPPEKRASASFSQLQMRLNGPNEHAGGASISAKDAVDQLRDCVSGGVFDVSLGAETLESLTLKTLKTKLMEALESRLDGTISLATLTNAAPASDNTGFTRFVAHMLEKVEALLYYTKMTKNKALEAAEVIGNICVSVASAQSVAHGMNVVVQQSTNAKPGFVAKLKGGGRAIVKYGSSMLSGGSKQEAADEAISELKEKRGSNELFEVAEKIREEQKKLGPVAKEITTLLSDVASFLAVEVSPPGRVPSAADLKDDARDFIAGELMEVMDELKANVLALADQVEKKGESVLEEVGDAGGLLDELARLAQDAVKAKRAKSDQWRVREVAAAACKMIAASPQIQGGVVADELMKHIVTRSLCERHPKVKSLLSVDNDVPQWLNPLLVEPLLDDDVASVGSDDGGAPFGGAPVDVITDDCESVDGDVEGGAPGAWITDGFEDGRAAKIEVFKLAFISEKDNITQELKRRMNVLKDFEKKASKVKDDGERALMLVRCRVAHNQIEKQVESTRELSSMVKVKVEKVEKLRKNLAVMDQKVSEAHANLPILPVESDSDSDSDESGYFDSDSDFDSDVDSKEFGSGGENEGNPSGEKSKRVGRKKRGEAIAKRRERERQEKKERKRKKRKQRAASSVAAPPEDDEGEQEDEHVDEAEDEDEEVEVVDKAEKARLFAVWANAPEQVSFDGGTEGATKKMGGVYKLSAVKENEPPLYVKRLKNGRKRFLLRGKKSGKWKLTCSEANVARSAGFIHSSRKSDLPTEAGLEWTLFAGKGNGWHVNPDLKCTEGAEAWRATVKARRVAEKARIEAVWANAPKKVTIDGVTTLSGSEGKCVGTYKLSVEKANGAPIYVNQLDESEDAYYLYRDHHERWMVVNGKSFIAKNMGFVNASRTTDLPSEVAEWYVSIPGGGWQVDSNVTCNEEEANFLDDAPAKVILSGCASKPFKMGVYELDKELSEERESPCFVKTRADGGKNFLYRADDSTHDGKREGLWICTSVEQDMTDNKGSIRSQTSEELPTTAGLKWIQAKGMVVKEGDEAAAEYVMEEKSEQARLAAVWDNAPAKVTLSGHTGNKHHFMGVYELSAEKANGAPLYEQVHPLKGSKRYLYWNDFGDDYGKWKVLSETKPFDKRSIANREPWSIITSTRGDLPSSKAGLKWKCKGGGLDETLTCTEGEEAWLAEAARLESVWLNAPPKVTLSGHTTGDKATLGQKGKRSKAKAMGVYEFSAELTKEMSTCVYVKENPEQYLYRGGFYHAGTSGKWMITSNKASISKSNKSLTSMYPSVDLPHHVSGPQWKVFGGKGFGWIHDLSLECTEGEEAWLERCAKLAEEDSGDSDSDDDAESNSSSDSEQG